MYKSTGKKLEDQNNKLKDIVIHYKLSTIKHQHPE